MNIQLGACDCLGPDWLDGFYPDDLPRDWLLDYYANEYPIVCLHVERWEELRGLGLDWPEQLTGFIEITREALREPAILSALPPARALIVHDENAQSRLEASGVKGDVILAEPGSNGWRAKLAEGRLLSLKPALPLDLRALRRDIESWCDPGYKGEGYLILDAPPMVLEQCRILLELMWPDSGYTG